MTEESYREWIAWHCKFLCRNNADYRAMLHEWRREFENVNATSDDLNNATRWLATDWLPTNSTAAWAAYPGIILGWIKRKREREAAMTAIENRRNESKRAKNGSVRQDTMKSLADEIGRGGKSNEVET